MRRFLGALLVLLAPMAAADDVAKGFENLTTFLKYGTNHNWLCAQVKAGSEAEAQLATFRKTEGDLLMMRTDASRKLMGLQVTRVGMQDLAATVTDPATFTLPAHAVDAWGTPLRFIAEGGKFRIVSAGADKTFQPATWDRPGAAADVAEDIVFEDGRFVRQPDEAAIMDTADKTVRTIPQPVEPALRDTPGTRFQRIEGTITGPVVVDRIDPQYPEEYRRLRISGIVILELAIDETGKAHNFAVLKSLGPALDAAAIDAVRRWKFAPARRDGEAIPVLYNLTIHFKLT